MEAFFIAFYFLGLWAAYNNQHWFGLYAAIFFFVPQKKDFRFYPAAGYHYIFVQQYFEVYLFFVNISIYEQLVRKL
jgi:hypothetical protein